MQIHTWLVLALLTGFADIAYNFASRKFLRSKGDPLVFSWWFTVIRSIVAGLLVLLFVDKIALSINTLSILSVIGLGNALNVYLFMRMHSLTQLSLSAIIVQLRIVWVPIIAFFLAGEILARSEYFGVVLLLVAVLVLRPIKRLILDRTINTALAFSISTSFLTVLLKMVSATVPVFAIIFFMSLPAIFIFPFLVAENARLFVNWKQDFPKRLLVVLLSFVSISLLLSALAAGGPVGKVNALTQILAAFGGATGIVFLKERDDLGKKLIALGLVACGIALMV